MPLARIGRSPLAPDEGPTSIYYREYGTGRIPLVFLHGGWGYEVYPFDRQIEAFGRQFRIIVPDRTGYGRSMHLPVMPEQFHRRAAAETIAFLEVIGVKQAVFWGHSDGAVIGAIIGIKHPDRCFGLVMEAFHYYRDKRHSREFFETMMANATALGKRVPSILARDHGDARWQSVLRMNGIAWLKLVEQGNQPENDFYEGRLADLSVPAILVHGADDPRSEPGEIEAVARQLPGVQVRLIEGGGHSPHSKRDHASECNKAVEPFLTSLAMLVR